jgi:hypothetical protein
MARIHRRESDVRRGIVKRRPAESATFVSAQLLALLVGFGFEQAEAAGIVAAVGLVPGVVSAGVDWWRRRQQARLDEALYFTASAHGREVGRRGGDRLMAKLTQWFRHLEAELRSLEAELVARLNAWSRRMQCWQRTHHIPELGCTCDVTPAGQD